MHLKKGKRSISTVWRLLWKRFYSVHSRTNMYSARSRKRLVTNFTRVNGLLLSCNCDTFPYMRTLWRYFNAPGNVMFVTTNIVAFMGIVAYNTMITVNNERAFEEQMIAAQMSLAKQRKGFETGALTLSRDTELDDQEDDIKCERPASGHADPFVQEQDGQLDSPIKHHTLADLVSNKEAKVADYDSQRVKASIFHMLYAYMLYRDTIQPKTEVQNHSSKEWRHEVELLIKGKQAQGTHQRIDVFYDLWNKKFDKVVTSPEKVQNFELPDWSKYPTILKFVCTELHNNDLKTLDEFKQFYGKVRSNEVKKLLGLWLYDHSFLFPRNLYDNESEEGFYDTLIKDSIQDNKIFQKYSSIVMNPYNERTQLFFPNIHTQPANKPIPSISLETYTRLLSGYITLQETNCKYDYNDNIFKLISILKLNCFLQRNRKKHPAANVRILLPKDEDRSQALSTISQAERKTCYQILSKNRDVIALLKRISDIQADSS
ncbi:Pet494p [Saccharomyces cerevisiae x Saccharomyces kudriavzevii VIN7]|uniref:Pet494p n=1 Tax=Saccharomyces cerevisiae x Saccharomyces kudriavzevii (strain VIN7) TaxID=1095631 RepID=H0H0J7_SACCK|nr:Pet494p [Saccharomyces cerevisiae x Saccharomyces kudriavzevii VIN7]